MSLRKLKKINLQGFFLLVVLLNFTTSEVQGQNGPIIGPLPSAQDISDPLRIDKKPIPRVLSLTNYKKILPDINKDDKVYAEAARLVRLYQERSLKVCSQESINLLPKAPGHSAYVFVFYLGSKCLKRLAVSDDTKDVYSKWLNYVLDHETQVAAFEFLDSEKMMIKAALSNAREALFRRSDELGLKRIQNEALARRIWDTDSTVIAMKLFEFYMDKNDEASAKQVLKKFDPDLNNIKILKKLNERSPDDVYAKKLENFKQAKANYKKIKSYYRAKKYKSILKAYKNDNFKESNYYKRASKIIAWTYAKADKNLRTKIIDEFSKIDVDFEVFAWILSNRGLHEGIFKAYEQVKVKNFDHYRMVLRALLYQGDYIKAVKLCKDELKLMQKVKANLKKEPNELNKDLNADVLYWASLNYIRALNYKEVLPILKLLETTNSDYRLQAMYFRHRILKNELKDSSYKKIAKKLIQKYPLSFYGVLVAHEEGMTDLLPFMDEDESFYLHLDLNDKNLNLLRQISFVINQNLLSGLKTFLDKTLMQLNLSGETLLAKYFQDIDKPLHAIKLMNDVWTKDHSFIRRDLISIAYPTKLLEKIKTQKEGDLPASLILSVIRQESAFQERALSPSYARGLMQLLTPTAREMARYLRIGRVRFPSALYNPDINIKLGSYYLYRLSQSYENHLPLAFASYNAGPGRMSKWSDSRSIITNAQASIYSNDWKDQDLWVEELPWSETRFYVKALLRNYLLYSLFDEFKPLKGCYRLWNCQKENEDEGESS